MTGCSAQNHSSESNSSESDNVIIAAGLTNEQTKGFGQAINEANAKNQPLHKGRELEKSEDWEEAIDYYHEMLNDEEFYWEAHRGLARCYEATRDYQTAVYHLESAPLADWAKHKDEQKIAELRQKASAQKNL